MTRYRVSIYQEEWLDYFVEADSEEEAEEKVSNGEFDMEDSKQASFDILEVEEVAE